MFHYSRVCYSSSCKFQSWTLLKLKIFSKISSDDIWCRQEIVKFLFSYWCLFFVLLGSVCRKFNGEDVLIGNHFYSSANLRLFVVTNYVISWSSDITFPPKSAFHGENGEDCSQFNITGKCRCREDWRFKHMISLFSRISRMSASPYFTSKRKTNTLGG